MRTTINGIFFKARSLESEWESKKPIKPKKSNKPMSKQEEKELREWLTAVGGGSKKMADRTISAAKKARLKECLSKDPKTAKKQLKRYEADLAQWEKEKKEAFAERARLMQRQEADRARRDAEAQQPFKRSDGYWYTWVNDGRGGYDQILPRSEQDRLDFEGTR